MNPTDILLSIAIVGIYTLIYVYLKSKYDDKQIITMSKLANILNCSVRTVQRNMDLELKTERDLLNEKKLDSIPQNKHIQAFYGKTPGIKDFIYLFFRKRVH